MPKSLTKLSGAACSRQVGQTGSREAKSWRETARSWRVAGTATRFGMGRGEVEPFVSLGTPDGGPVRQSSGIRVVSADRCIARGHAAGRDDARLPTIG